VKRCIPPLLCLLLGGCGDHVSDESGMIRSLKLEGWNVQTNEVAIRSLHKDAVLLYQKDAATIALWYSPERSGFGLMTDYSNPQAMTSWINDRGTVNGFAPTITDTQAMIVSGLRASRVTYEAGGQRVRVVRADAPKRWFAVECVLPLGQDPAEAHRALDAILADVRFREPQSHVPAIFTLGPGFAATMILVVLLRRWLKK
jgi:hypothetical protein